MVAGPTAGQVEPLVLSRLAPLHHHHARVHPAPRPRRMAASVPSTASSAST